MFISFFEDGDNLLPRNKGIRLTKDSGSYPKQTESRLIAGAQTIITESRDSSWCFNALTPITILKFR